MDATVLAPMTESHVDVEGLYAALDAKRTAKKMSWRDLAAAVSISPSTLTRMAKGHRPDVDGFAALVTWLQVPADEFFLTSPHDKKPRGRNEDFLVVVSRHLRAQKDLEKDKAQLLERIIKAAYQQITGSKDG